MSILDLYNTTPYVNFYWNIAEGPVVIEIPPSADGVGIFGTIMDAWQRPLDDVGVDGRDRGRGVMLRRSVELTK